MYVSDFKLVDILKDKMGDDEARILVEYIETRVENKFSEATQVFATKEDLLRLELKIQESIHKGNFETQRQIGEIQKQMGEIQKEIGIVQKEIGIVQKEIGGIQKEIGEIQKETSGIQKEVSGLQKEIILVRKEIADSKSETLKWMFAMFITATIAIIGTMLTVMKMGGWGN